MDNEEEVVGIPEWVVTFGDMMSLLLTFFIMLVSMSEIKEEERFQALVSSMRRQFGHEATMMPVPGEQAPRNSDMYHTASTGRAKRKDTLRGGDKVKAVVGSNAQVRELRPGKHSVEAGRIPFPVGSIELSDKAKSDLQRVVQQISGKPQLIEVRGHTTRRPLPTDANYRDRWDLSYERSRVVMQFLVNQGIDPKRIQLKVVAENQPADEGTEAEAIDKNSRVEVFLWDERVRNGP